MYGIRQFLLAMPLLIVCESHVRAAGSELPRRALFGARLSEVSAARRQRLPSGGGGALISGVVPGSAAAEAGFQPGDIVLTIDNAQIAGVSSLLDQIARRQVSDQMDVQYIRDGSSRKARVTLKEMPRERGDGYDVVYASVRNGGFRLRTIVTRPRDKGRRPAVLLLQGGQTCFAVDDPFGRPTPFVRVAQHLAKNGYVTMRVERPGCGDSEGGPLRDVDFDTELSGNLQALRDLKQLDAVDRDNVLIYGFSMGGIMAPLIAVDEPVRGIAVYGTACSTWFENVINQRRRLSLLSGMRPAEVDEELLGFIRFWYQLAVEKKTIREIAETKSIPPPLWNRIVSQDAYVAGRHFKFYQQLSDRNLAAAWDKVATTRLPATDGKTQTPRVLAVWGTSDWHASSDSTHWIAKIVNRAKPGNATYIALDASDHFFNHVATPQESYRILYGTTPTANAPFNPAILKTLLTWCNETVSRKTQS